jgi:hypothetical protein
MIFMTAKIIDLGFDERFHKEQELMDSLIDVMHERKGEISFVSALGVIELLKAHLINEAKESLEI